MARLIKTEKEVEGRYTETWVVVEEDALDLWPAGPGEVVGRPAPKVDGYERARGEARFTADVRLPGMLQAAYLRSPHAHAKLKRIDADRAKEAPGVRGVLVAGEVDWLSDAIFYEGQPVAALAADTADQARAALDLIDVEWDVLEPLLDPEEAVRRGSLIGEARHYERGDYERGLAEADVVVEAEFRTQTSTTTHWRRTSASATGVAKGSTSTSRRSTSGASETRSPRRSGWRPTRCESSASTWAAVSAPRAPRATTRCSQRSLRGERVGPCTTR